MLSVQGLTASYGQAQALFGVDLQIAQGQALALLGRNGMGKSTTIRVICGLLKAQTGKISLDEQVITGLPSFRIAQRGIGLVPEGRRCFATLSVAENLLATARPGVWDIARAYALFPRLAERKTQLARTLSGGEQQMLAIARALLTNPRLMILDEATEGLAPLIRREIWAVLRQLADDGLTLLIVDKSLKELLPIVNSCTILERGKSVWTGAPVDLNTDLKSRYLGV